MDREGERSEVWQFDVEGPVWSRALSAAPTEESKKSFWQAAVPRLAMQNGEVVAQPAGVVCRVTAPGSAARSPAGPTARAKGLVDALHDDRRSGPWFRSEGWEAPLADDKPIHVAGLAVEVRVGPARTEYRLGSRLVVAGKLLSRVEINMPAPNDIAGTLAEKGKIAAARLEYSAAVRDAFSALPTFDVGKLTGLVVRHHPQRDEDNTWATWVTALCARPPDATDHWARGAPLAGWRPRAIASVADPALPAPVVYELWA